VVDAASSHHRLGGCAQGLGPAVAGLERERHVDAEVIGGDQKLARRGANRGLEAQSQGGELLRVARIARSDAERPVFLQVEPLFDRQPPWREHIERMPAER
jgi:hypothetical protein